jgi:hypothetical protein
MRQVIQHLRQAVAEEAAGHAETQALAFDDD